MNTSLRTYADAYINALPKDRDVVKEFDVTVDLILKAKVLRAFLEDDSVPLTTRRGAMKEAFPGAADETTNFISLLAQDGRIGDLEALKSHVRAAVAEKQGKRHALVTSAAPLTGKDMDRITASLGKKLGTDILLEERTDPSLIAGFQVTSNGWTFDASLKGKLDRLQHALNV